MEDPKERLTTSISSSELERRWEAAREMMRDRKIDFLLMRMPIIKPIRPVFNKIFNLTHYTPRLLISQRRFIQVSRAELSPLINVSRQFSAEKSKFIDTSKLL